MEESKKKKVLVIAPGMEIGGIERSTLGLLDVFDYNAYDVDLFLLAHTGELMPFINPNVKLLKEKTIFSDQYRSFKDLVKSRHFFSILIKAVSKAYSNIRKSFYGKSNVYMSAYQMLACKFVKKIRKHYDIALSMFQPHSFLINKVSADLKVGWVHTDLGSPDNNEDYLFLHSMWSKLNHIACVSELVLKSFGKLYPDLKDRLFVFENINFVRLILSQSQEKEVAVEINSPHSILSVGRYDPDKNFDKIPEMCYRIMKKVKDVKWYIIGYGNAVVEKSIRDSIRKYKLEDRVVILGKKSNPYPYLKNSTLFVLPSSDEGKSVVVVESQILGTPVVITEYPTSGSQLDDGADGIIAPMDFVKCADIITELLCNPERLKQISDCCLSRDYSNSQEIKKIYELYEREVYPL